MAKRVQHYRATVSQIALITGLQGEIITATDTPVITLHDGATVGGFSFYPDSYNSAKYAQLANIAGSGGSVANSGNVTLVYNSPGAQQIAPTGPGQYVTLPDATTCPLNASLFTIKNTSIWHYGIKDNSGAKLGWVRPGEATQVGLAAKATPAGNWNLTNVTKIAITAQGTPNIGTTTLSTSGTAPIIVQLDSTRELILNCGVYAPSSVSYLKGIVVNSANAAASQFGAITTLYTVGAALCCNAILIAANTVLLFLYDSSSTKISAIVLTITGTTISVGSTYTVTPGNPISGLATPVAVGSTYCLGWYSANSAVVGFVACTVSGSVVTFGSVVTDTGASNLIWVGMYASGSVLRTVYQSGSNIKAQPYTVSGTTLTAGTAASFATGAVTAGVSVRTLLLGDGNILATNQTDTNGTVGCFKLTGTTEAVTTATLSVNSGSVSNFDWGVAGSNIAITASTISGLPQCQVITDTNGTVSIGTATTYGSGSGFTFVGLISSSVANGTITFAIANSTTSTPQQNSILTATASGTTVNIAEVSSSGFNTLATNQVPFIPQPSPTQYNGATDGCILTAGNSAYIIGGGMGLINKTSSTGIYGPNPYYTAIQVNDGKAKYV